MSLLKPSPVEQRINAFFGLEPDRLDYYKNVFTLARVIFIMMGSEDKAVELQKMIQKSLEEPLQAPLFAILQAYYNIRFINSKIAYCKVGSGIDATEFTRYEMTVILEEIKEWCYDEVTNLTQYVRFTRYEAIA